MAFVCVKKGANVHDAAAAAGGGGRLGRGNLKDGTAAGWRRELAGGLACAVECGWMEGSGRGS